MECKWKFVKEADTIKEKALGRDHQWYFNAEVTQKAGTYMVTVKVPPGSGHDFHRHPEMHEIIYILSGQAEQWVEDEKQQLGPGDAVYIDTNVVHAIFNTGDQELSFLAILSPSAGWEAGTIDEYMNLPYSEYRGASSHQ